MKRWAFFLIRTSWKIEGFCETGDEKTYGWRQDKYSELSGEELKNKLKEFVTIIGVDFEQVKKYLSLFPDRVYKNIYHGGLMNELV